MTHPSAFGPAGNEATSGAVPGETITFATWIYPDSVVELRSVEPVVAANTADADLSLYACPVTVVIGPGEPPEAWQPYSPGMSFGEGTQELVLRVTSESPGIVDVDGFTVKYRLGLRFGSSITGLHVAACFGPDPEECGSGPYE